MNAFMCIVQVPTVSYVEDVSTTLPEPSRHGVIVSEGASEASRPRLRDAEDAVKGECRAFADAKCPF